MFTRILAVLALVAVSACSKNDGPILVGQGTGESEYSLAFARMNLVELLRSCNGVCVLDQSQRAFLDDITKLAAKAPVAHFEINGSQNMYRFTNPKYTDVVFNHNQLWQDADHKVAFDIPYAVGVWIDVLMYTKLVKSAESADSVKFEIVNVLRQRIQRVEATYEQKTPFVAMTWKGKSADRLYIRNAVFENTEVTPKLAVSMGCDGGTATEIVINSVRFSSITEDTDGSLSVLMETTQNFNCALDARRSRAKILFRSFPPTEDGVHFVREDSFKIFAEGE
jgi:hypothetical protein